MAYRDLRNYLLRLERCGQLKRIRAPVSQDLEITEIADRVVKGALEKNVALLFENVRDHALRMPIAINLFGTEQRMAWALGVERLNDLNEKLSEFISMDMPRGLIEKATRGLEMLSGLKNTEPRYVNRAACQEVVMDPPRLSALPILKCWPKDGGRTITFAVTITKDPDSGDAHAGIYRLQQYGRDTLGFHAQIHRVGANNLRKWAARGERMPVAAVLGGDPATVFSGLAPVPEGLSNFVFAGFLRGAPVEMVPARSVDLEVPAQAEIVLEGYVDPTERTVEGPFGDHTGYYSAAEPFPVVHVTRVTRRERPVYLTTVTGRPPTEDSVLGKAVERIFRPVVRLVLPELVDMNLPQEGLFINVGIVSIRKAYPGHPRKVMHALWGLGQLMFVRYLIVVDEDVDVHDLSEVLYRVGLQADPARDLERVEGPVDQLSISNPVPNFGGKVGIDATRKRPEDGFPRPWPEEIRSDPAAAKAAERAMRSDPTLAALLDGRPR